MFSIERFDGGTSRVLEGTSSQIEDTVFNHMLVDWVHPFVRISKAVFASVAAAISRG
jgi:hypothetical protein